MALPSAGRREIRHWDDDDNETGMLDELAAVFHRKQIGERLIKLHTQVGMDEERIAVYDGDLHLPELDTIDEQLSVLIVFGALIIDGCFGDSYYPETFIHVTGSLRAHDVIASGWLEVCGSVTVARALLGDHNDCSTWFGANVTCDVFYPQYYSFEFAGKLTARTTLDRDSDVVRDYDKLKQRVRAGQPIY